MGHLLFVVGMIIIDAICLIIFLNNNVVLSRMSLLLIVIVYFSLDILFAHYYRYNRNSSHTQTLYLVCSKCWLLYYE